MTPHTGTAPSLDFIFGEEHERWLRRFAGICIRRGVPLCTIQLTYLFDEEDWKRAGLTRSAVAWPWPRDYMARLKSGLEPRSIAVEFELMDERPGGPLDLTPLGSRSLQDVMVEMDAVV